MELVLLPVADLDREAFQLPVRDVPELEQVRPVRELLADLKSHNAAEYDQGRSVIRLEVESDADLRSRVYGDAANLVLARFRAAAASIDTSLTLVNAATCRALIGHDRAISSQIRTANVPQDRGIRRGVEEASCVVVRDDPSELSRRPP